MSLAEYHQLWQQRLMIEDDERNRAFREAIEKTVRPGDVVLDMGAGTGLLSIFAARAGADRVYALEATRMALFARELVRHNGCADRVKVIQGLAQDAEIPEKADVIVSEWLGSYAIDENLLDPLVQVRTRHLKPDGIMIPRRVSIWMAPAWDEEIHRQERYWAREHQNIDFSPLNDRLLHEPQWSVQNILPKDLLADPRKLWDLNMNEVTEEEAAAPFESTTTFEIRDEGRINALALWFSAELAEGVPLSNAPDCPWTHWGRFVLPCRASERVSARETISVRFRSEPAGPGYTRQIWSTQLGNDPWQHYDSNNSEL